MLLGAPTGGISKALADSANGGGNPDAASAPTPSDHALPEGLRLLLDAAWRDAFATLLYAPQDDRRSPPEPAAYPARTIAILNRLAAEPGGGAATLARALDYDLGPVANCRLYELLAAAGSKAVSEVRRRAQTPPDCAPGYLPICRADGPARDRILAGLLAAIDRGAPYCPAP